MSTLIATRITTPIPVRHPVRWPTRVTILDVDGGTLSEAEVLGDIDDLLLFGEVTAPDHLLAYYFGKSGRQIMLDLGNQTVDARLETRWESGGRGWWAELDGAATH